MLDTIVVQNKMQIKIKDTKYSRDLDNMAVLCNDLDEVNKYKIEMEKMKKSRSIDNEINTLKSEVAEIKSLLQKIIDRI